MLNISVDEKTLLTQFFSNVITIDNDNLLEIRTFKNQKPYKNNFFNNPDHAIDYMNKLEKGVDIYYGMASRKDASSGSKRNCNYLKCLYLDIDYGTEGHKKESLLPNKENALQFIDTLLFPKPSIIISSGNGIHLYWLLNDEITLNPDSIQKIENLMKQMATIYGADSTQDVSRIFRVPYTINYKGNDPKRCEFIKANYDLKYDISYLESNKLLDLQLDKIKTAKSVQHDYYSVLFGKTDSWDTDDRSIIDQSLITFLLRLGYRDEEIKDIFDNFPTTGKYGEHNSKEKYLSHSITNARKYIKTYKPEEHKSEVTLDEQNPFIVEDSGPGIGYYQVNRDGNYSRLTNFTINLEHRITKIRNDEIESFYPGKIIIEEKEYPFKRINTKQLTDTTAFKTFIHNVCGTNVYIAKPSPAMQAVMFFNRGIPEFQEREFGYNLELTEYVTETQIIKKDEIQDISTPIKYSEVWGKNTLGFKYLNSNEVNDLIKDFISTYLSFHDTKVILITLAFAFYPLIYPFLRDENPNKFYLMLCGTSGSGKTTIAKFLQNLYGTFWNLFTWTSTDTSISIVGSAFRDCLFVIDDLKSTNFRHEKDISKAMGMLQNYSDCNGRNRGRVDLTLQEQRVIEGHLLMTGEDMPFTEASTLARGLIIDVNSQPRDDNKFTAAEELGRKTAGITPFFIQQLMKNYSKKSITTIFRECKRTISDFNLFEHGISNDNYSRSVNNTAALFTSWKIVSDILLKPFIGEKYQDVLPSILKDVMLNNLKRVNTYRQDKLFEDLLWEFLQSGKLKLKEYALSGEEINDYGKRETIGAFTIKENKEIDLVISLKSALRDIKRCAPELNITAETLEKKLLSEKKIYTNNSGKHRIAGHGIRGVLWTGEIPNYVFDIEDNNPIDQTYDILEIQEHYHEKANVSPHDKSENEIEKSSEEVACNKGHKRVEQSLDSLDKILKAFDGVDVTKPPRGYKSRKPKRKSSSIKKDYVTPNI